MSDYLWGATIGAAVGLVWALLRQTKMMSRRSDWAVAAAAVVTVLMVSVPLRLIFG